LVVLTRTAKIFTDPSRTTTRSGAGRKAVIPQELARIERGCGPVLDRLGYTRVLPI
jgi:hypothetical protein